MCIERLIISVVKRNEALNLSWSDIYVMTLIQNISSYGRWIFPPTENRSVYLNSDLEFPGCKNVSTTPTNDTLQNMQSNVSPKLAKPKRSIFSNFVYKTNNDVKRMYHKPGDFKSLSADVLDQPFSPKLQNYQSELNRTSIDLDDTKESCTQTSKTILQLAQLESGELSPDSLAQSPKTCYDRSDYEKNTLAKVMHSYRNVPEMVAKDPEECNHTSFARKSNVFNYIRNSGSSEVPPNSEENVHTRLKIDKPLTQTFLDKSRPKPQANPLVNTLFVNPRNTGSHMDRSYPRQNSSVRKLMNIPGTNNSFNLKSISCIETYPPNFIDDNLGSEADPTPKSNSIDRARLGKYANNSACGSEASSSPRSCERSRKSSFMQPTIASERRNNQSAIKNMQELFTPTIRGRSSTPGSRATTLSQPNKKIPYIDTDTYGSGTTDNDLMKDDNLLVPPLKMKNILNEDRIDDISLDLNSSEDTIGLVKHLESLSTVSCDNFLTVPLARLKDKDWTNAIRGLAEIVDFCRLADVDVVYPHMSIINQRLIELLRSPRSHVCRTACQAAGHLFELIKDTRRPEFDELVDLLLFKTADANKFIRQDANLALDCMVTHIQTCHSIRAICSKGPTHKNHLVRIATVRLIVCAVVIAGADSILNPNNNEHTRKRIIIHLPKFLEDKNTDVRKFGERLYKVLSKEFRFELYLKKYLEKDEALKMKKNLRVVTTKK